MADHTGPTRGAAGLVPVDGLAHPDGAMVVAGFGAALRAAGLPVGPDRTTRFAQAIATARPRTTRALYWCALASLVSDPTQIEVLDRVFAAVFGGLLDPAEQRGDPNADTVPAPRQRAPRPSHPVAPASVPFGVAEAGQNRSAAAGDHPDSPQRALSSSAERLSTRDFAELSVDELLMLADLMRRRSLTGPPRRSRRFAAAGHGERVDLRATLRRARLTGGEPVRVCRARRRLRPRRLVVLCDISGSMEPYARAMLQLLCCAAGDRRAEVFTFATRLTRVTGIFAGARPAQVLERAGRAAPDWSGGTRIGAAVKEFNDSRRELARGAVVVVISDGWETGDPAPLGREMSRLARVAYRIVWVNPRTQDPRYRPLVGGMAAALPYCDAVVSAHRLDALDELAAAVADPVRHRPHRPAGRPRRERKS